MERELEVAAADAAGGLLARRNALADPPGSPCANCAARLQGPYCHSCGQFAEDYHRSIAHLFLETLESLFHFDGRIWNTMPRLVRAPGQLTRDYLDGHRAPQIPPLRLFLVVLLLVFLCGGLGQGANFRPVVVDARHGLPKSAEEVKALAEEQAHGDVQVDLGRSATAKARSAWLRERIMRAQRNPEQFTSAMEAWAHRLAILALPIGALFLALLYASKRRFYVYDHLIFTMHSLSFQGLLVSAFFLASNVIGDIAALLFLAAPVHLFVHMRGVYGSSIAGTLARMAVLAAGSAVGFTLLMMLLVLIGLNGMGG